MPASLISASAAMLAAHILAPQSISSAFSCDPQAAQTPCLAVPHGVVVGKDQASVQAAAAEAEAAEALWSELTGTSAPPYAVVLDSAIDAATLKAGGYQTVLSWLTIDAKRAMMNQAVRDAVRAQLPAGTESAAAEEAALRQASPQIEASLAKTAQPGVMAHELGHIWYGATAWKDVAGEQDSYGTPAPDWLDEAMAVMMEGDTLTEARRRSFRDGWRRARRPAAISELMQEVHPAYANGATTARLVGTGAIDGGPRVMMMDGAEFQKRTGTDIDAAAGFYARVRAWLDFIDQRTGDPEALPRLARTVRAGGSLQTWLDGDPSGRRLGATPEAVDRAFAEWADDQARSD